MVQPRRLHIHRIRSTILGGMATRLLCERVTSSGRVAWLPGYF